MATDSSEVTLRVIMSGVCLHVFDTNRPRLVVVMPDARLKEDGADLKHRDGTPAEPHVGYLRFDIRNLLPARFGRGLDRADFEPIYEVVHRFDRERVELVGVPTEADPVSSDPPDVPLQEPALDGFAPILKPDDRIFNAVPPETVLMRMDLFGGSVRVPRVDPFPWELAGDLNPSGVRYRGDFGGSVHWTRRVTLPGNVLHVRLTGFDDGRETIIPLHPVAGSDGEPTIMLQVANLCKVNPLEWPELPLRQPSTTDVDFKWLYTLLDAIDPADVERLSHAPLPVPVAVVPENADEGDLVNCTGLRATAAVP